MTSLKRRLAAAGLMLAFGAGPALAQEISVWKSPTCGCCVKWAAHLAAEGFTVKTADIEDIELPKAALGVPPALAGCHTAQIGGYVIEGHVPAASIRRLLRERPAVAGLAVPGMPVGSPGMEVPGQPAEAFAVIAFTADGASQVYDRY